MNSTNVFHSKINVSIDLYTDKTINSDLVYFKFKSKNSLITSILNANEKYLIDKINQFNLISTKFGITSPSLNELIENFFDISYSKGTTRNSIIKITPTKDNAKILSLLENYYNNVFNAQISKSSLIFSLLQRYTSMSRASREQFIFQDNFHIISKSITNNTILTITENISNKVLKIKPIELLSLLDNEALFLTYEDIDNNFKLIRLSQIKYIIPSDTKYTISESNLEKNNNLSRLQLSFSPLVSILDNQITYEQILMLERTLNILNK